ncbi:MAG: 2,3-cyclic 3-phosphodiesterase [Solirubrobacteraceae bacterium]|nr:2,3-cyclic 3-phosphodiesterase [Solirubrobacteraceae bacterium]
MSARLFVALELPEEVRGALGSFGRTAAADDFALRAVGERGMHLTLAFLGHRALDEVEPAAAAVAALAAPAPRLELGEALWLAPRRPHVLTVAVADPDGVLVSLHAEILARLGEALPAWAPETRPLRPHITVARVRRGAQPRMTGLPTAPVAAWTSASVVLFRSFLGGGAARPEALARAELR